MTCLVHVGGSREPVIELLMLTKNRCAPSDLHLFDWGVRPLVETEKSATLLHNSISEQI